MPKTPEEILSEFEERYYTSEHPYQMMCREHAAPATISEVKSFLTESLAAYRLSLLSECEGLVEESDSENITCHNLLCEKCSKTYCGDCPYCHRSTTKACMDAKFLRGFNAANALWRERIAALK